LSSDYPDIAGSVEFKLPEEVTSGQFDIVVSKDSFQHYNDPESVLSQITQLTAPGGLIVIGLGPLWKSPYGGAIDFMTKLPWAHLIFSEKVIMRGRMRYRPEEKAQAYKDARGGFNKMTLGRFQRLVDGSGLKVLSFRTNASSGSVGRASRLLAAIPGLRELFTLNVYVVLSVPKRAEE
jgi:SAM-dependent methyltransferase